MEQLKRFTLFDLNKLLQQSSDDEFEAWLQQCGLLHKNRPCECGRKMTLTGKNRTKKPLWLCSNTKFHNGKQMRKGFYTGTFLSYQSSPHISPKKIFRFTYYWCWDLLSQYADLDSGLKLQGHQTIEDWKNFCREVCLDWYRKNLTTNNGNKIDEKDELNLCEVLWKKQFAGLDIFYHFWSQVAQMYPLQQQQSMTCSYNKENGTEKEKGTAENHVAIEEEEIDQKQEPQQQENSVMNNGGKSFEQWRFLSQVASEQHLQRICRNFGLVNQNTSGRNSSDDAVATAFYKCQIAGCPFNAIYIKFESILYAINEHNHLAIEQQKTAEESSAQDAFEQSIIVENHDVKEEGEEEDEEEIVWMDNANGNADEEKQQQFDIYYNYNSIADEESAANDTGEIAAAASSSSFSHQCQENPTGTMTRSQQQPDMHIAHHIPDEQLLRQVCARLRAHKNTASTIYFQCRRTRCRFLAVYKRSNSVLYALGEHNHRPLVLEAMVDENADHISGTGRMVDSSGKVWHFLSAVQNEAQLPLVCLRNELARWAACSSRRYYICKRADQYPSRKRGLPHCPLRAIYHKDKRCLYVDGQHNHPILMKPTMAAANNNE